MSQQLFPQSAAKIVASIGAFCVGLSPQIAQAEPVSYTLQQNRPPKATGDGLMFTIKDKRLIANDERTGRRRWAFGSNIGADMGADANGRHYRNGLILYNAGRVYTFSDDGTLSAVHSRTGKRAWKFPCKTDEIRALEVAKGTLFVTQGYGVLALNAATGREYWRFHDRASQPPNPFNEGWLNDAALLTKDVVLVSYLSDGAPLIMRTEGYNRHTGRYLWSWEGDLRDFNDDRATFSELMLDQDVPQNSRDTTTIIEMRTGKVISSITTDGNGKPIR